MQILYRLSKYAIHSRFTQDYWQAATCSYSRVSTLVDRVNSSDEYDRPLTFKSDGRTPEGVYRCRYTGAIYALRLEMVQLDYPEHGNTMINLGEKQWSPEPICPWVDADAYGKWIPPYRMTSLINYLTEALPERNVVEVGFIAGIIRRSIERNTVKRNLKKLLSMLERETLDTAFQIATTG